MSDFVQWVTHGIKRGRFEVGSHMALRLLWVVIALTVVAALYLALISQTAAQGRRIEQLQMDLLRLQRQNEQLESEIGEECSIPRLTQRAVEMGFAPAEQVDFLLPADD